MWIQKQLQYIAEIENPPYTMFVVYSFINKRIVGGANFVKTIFDQDNLDNDEEYYYGWLYVDEDMRRNGIGQKIIETGVEHLRAKGTKKLFAYIHKDNVASLNLHKKLLFQLSDNQEPVALLSNISTSTLPENEAVYERVL
jgi:RimJ/RimL family protein N-acetyltransferase